jgi:hypothetical protein
MDGDRCPIRHHYGRAWLAPNSEGDLAFWCSCCKQREHMAMPCRCPPKPTMSPLSNAFFSAETGVPLPVKLNASYRYVWRMLLAHRVGLLEPEPVELVEPSSQWPTVLALRDLFALKLGLERRLGSTQPTPLTRRLALWWLNPPGAGELNPPFSEEEVRDAFLCLRRDGVLHGHRDGDRGPLLYVPGDGTPDPHMRRTDEQPARTERQGDRRGHRDPDRRPEREAPGPVLRAAEAWRTAAAWRRPGDPCPAGTDPQMTSGEVSCLPTFIPESCPTPLISAPFQLNYRYTTKLTPAPLETARGLTETWQGDPDGRTR